MNFELILNSYQFCIHLSFAIVSRSNILLKDEELWFNDEEDFDEEGSGPVLGPGGLGEPTKASCTSVSTTSPQVED